MKNTLLFTIIVLLSFSCGPSPEEINDEWFNYYNYTDSAIMDKLSEIMKKKGNYPSKEFCTNEYQLNQESRTGYKADGTPGTNFTPQYWSKIKIFPFGKGDWYKGVRQTPWHSIEYPKSFSINWYLQLTPSNLTTGKTWKTYSHDNEYILYKIDGGGKIEQEPISFIIENFTNAEKQEFYACVDSVRNEFMAKNMYIINKHGNFEKDEKSWKDGKRHGAFLRWRQYSPDKKNCILDFKEIYDEGNLSKTFMYYYYDNGQKKVEVSIKNGEKEGKSTFWYEDGNIKQEVYYKSDKVDGLIIDYHENGEKKEEGNFKGVDENGIAIRYGLHTYWSDEGTKQKETNWNNGKKDGLHVSYSYNGKSKSLEGIYRDGQQHGVWNRYWSKGNKKHTESTWTDGKLNGLYTQWNQNGQKSSEGNYKDDKRDGLFTSWHKNEEKKNEGNYRDGYKIGLHIGWYDNGKKSSEENYKEEGSGHWWYRNGEKKKEGRFKNGRFRLDSAWDGNGEKVVSNGNGKFAFYIVFKDMGKFERPYPNESNEGTLYITYYQNGNLIKDEKYKEGNPVYKWFSYNTDGAVIETKDCALGQCD